MTTLYGLLALVGGVILVLQVAGSLIGLGGHADFDGGGMGGGDVGHDFDGDGGSDGAHEHSTLVGALSFRTLTAAATFFGLTGMIGTELDWAPWRTFILAAAAGTAALFAVHAVMRQLYALGTDGTVRHDGLPGHRGTVYVTIPAGRAGAGKVLVEYAERTVELQALTPEGREIPSGTGIVVRAVVGPDTVEVERVAAAEPVA